MFDCTVCFSVYRADNIAFRLSHYLKVLEDLAVIEKMDGNSNVSTKNRLLLLVDDVDLIIRQLFDTLSQQSIKNESADSENMTFKMDPGQLTDLLIQKNDALIKLASTARDQKKLYHHIELVKQEIDHQDKMIACLQKRLKQSESLLASALYQAKESLRSFDDAKKQSVMSEDIVRFAHQISACSSTAAPLNWTPGDPRRPYPQDIQMRCGWLGQLSNLSSAPGVDANLKPPPLQGTDGITLPDFSQLDTRWQQNSNLSNFNSMKHGDDVDVMSSDSSSSDSSDSSGND